MTVYMQKKWGIEIWKNKMQVGAAVGVTIAQVLGKFEMNTLQKRQWRKHGVLCL